MDIRARANNSNTPIRVFQDAGGTRSMIRSVHTHVTAWMVTTVSPIHGGAGTKTLRGFEQACRFYCTMSALSRETIAPGHQSANLGCRDASDFNGWSG